MSSSNTESKQQLPSWNIPLPRGIENKQSKPVNQNISIATSNSSSNYQLKPKRRALAEKAVSFRIPFELWEEIEKVSKFNDCSSSEIIRYFCAKGLEMDLLHGRD